MFGPYASYLKIATLILLFLFYRDYLPGEPSPFLSTNPEIASKSAIVREIGRAAFPVVWFGCVVTILLSPFLSVGPLRIPLVLLFLFAWLFNVTALRLGLLGRSNAISEDNTIESGALALFWIERRKFLDIFESFSEIWPALIAFGVLALVLVWRPSPRLAVHGKWNLLACLPIALVLGMAVYSRGGMSAFPTPLGLPIRFASAVEFVVRQDDVGERFHARPVTLQPTHPPFEKVILIMDESVRAGFIAPHLIEKWGLVNFGAAVSVGNCSHFARFIFKRGLRQADLPQAFMEHGLVSEEPTVWQYAKAAGFKTVYIDAVGDAVFHSGMNSDELSYIDERYNIVSRPVYNRDFDALEKLFDLLARPGRAFLYLDKQGVHHPYQNKFPPDMKRDFEGPTVRKTSNEELVGYQHDLLERYNKAVDWSVNRFLMRLFARGLPDDTLLIYTSDHGQSLVENDTKWTHCSSGPETVEGEALVPLLAFSQSDTHMSQQLRRNGSAYSGKYSHFQVFPTLLIAFGYPATTVSQLYSSSLLDAPPIARNFLRGGDVRRLEWQKVD